MAGAREQQGQWQRREQHDQHGAHNMAAPSGYDHPPASREYSAHQSQSAAAWGDRQTSTHRQEQQRQYRAGPQEQYHTQHAYDSDVGDWNKESVAVYERPVDSNPHLAPASAARGSRPDRTDGGRSGAQYRSAPQASESMADLAASLSTASSGGSPPGKKPKRVYNTAFGPFSWSDLLKRRYWKYYIGLALLSVLVLLAVIFHDDIIRWLEPFAEKVRDLTGGWAIFVGILFVISFPPLFGHEVVCLICGLIYGLWWGFAIVALGTMLGEWGNFFVFKYWCTQRSQKLEKKDLNYACICRVIRDGGFRIAFMARLSAIPGHLTTPAFAACGMSFWIFSITALLTLPKQLMAVYLGTVFGEDKEEESITTSKIVEWVVLGISFIVTIWAAWYIYAKMAKWRPIVLREWEENQVAAQEGVIEVVERDDRLDGQVTKPSLAGQSQRQAPYGQADSRNIPGFALTDEDGVVQAAHQRAHRLSGNRWRDSRSQPYHQDVSAMRLSQMEPGSMGDLEGASSSLVAHSAAPAGHYGSSSNQPRSSRGQMQHSNNLYPVQGSSPYASSEEDIDYGFADGGEVRNSLTTHRMPHEAAPQMNASPDDGASMRWNPPRSAPEQQEQQHSQAGVASSHPSEHIYRQPSPSPSQYSPTRYRRQYQPQSQPEQLDGHQQGASHPNTTSVSPHSSDATPSSVPPIQSYGAEYLQPDIPVQDARSAPPQHSSVPADLPRSEHASSVQGSVAGNSYGQSSGAPRRQNVTNTSYYPQNTDLMPQPGHSRPDGNSQSRYPAMRSAEASRATPIGATSYHTEPPSSATRRYHTEGDPNQPSPYHTRATSPAPTYHTMMPPQHSRQMQVQSQQRRPSTEYPPSEYPPSENLPRYQTPT